MPLEPVELLYQKRRREHAQHFKDVLSSRDLEHMIHKMRRHVHKINQFKEKQASQEKMQFVPAKEEEKDF